MYPATCTGPAYARARQRTSLRRKRSSPRCEQADELIDWAYNALRTSTPSGVVGGFEVAVGDGLGRRVGGGVVGAAVLSGGAAVLDGAMVVAALL